MSVEFSIKEDADGVCRPRKGVSCATFLESAWDREGPVSGGPRASERVFSNPRSPASRLAARARGRQVEDSEYLVQIRASATRDSSVAVQPDPVPEQPPVVS